jgi:hypothetical protein
LSQAVGSDGRRKRAASGVVFASGAAVGTEHFAIPMLPPAYPATVNNIDHRRSKKGVCLGALAPRRQRRIRLAVVQCPHDLGLGESGGLFLRKCPQFAR